MTARPSRDPLPAFTIAANNYLAFATVWADSYRRHHPGAEVYVALADRRDPRLDYGRFPFRTLFLEDLRLPCIESLAFRYTVLELATAVKPMVFRYLRDGLGHDRAVYFDPDILVCDRLHEVERTLARHPLALTPHLTAPLDNEHRPSERQVRMMGVYNLGFCAFRLDEVTKPFLGWWERRLERFCLVDPWHGNFVDQSWMDFAPAFLDDVAILRSPVLNVAYWNLPQRKLEERGGRFFVDGEPLGFIHFSGLDLEDLSTISRHQDRLPRRELGGAEPLLVTYRERVHAAGHRDLARIEYGFDHFEPGHLPIPLFLRRQLLRLDPHARRFRKPFDREHPDDYFAWLAESLDFELGSLNRAALALWESRPELVQRFPAVCHRDLPDFLEWLLDEGGGERAGLPPALLAGRVGGSRARARRPYQQEPLRSLVRLTRPEHPDWLEVVDLGSPGSWLSVLVETFPGAPADAPALTRVAMLLWERHRALQRTFPDPLGEDALELGRWIAVRGAAELGLSAEIVRAHAERLPAATASAPVREVGSLAPSDQPSAAVSPRSAASTNEARHSLRRVGVFGVTLLAPFHADSARALMAKELEQALREAGVAHRLVDLDHDFLGNCIEGLFAPPEGCELPVVLGCVDLRLAPWVLGWLPAAASQGGRRVGYVDWDFEALPPLYAERLGQWDEIWAPSEHSRAALAAATDLPVRVVPPPVTPLPAADAPSIPLAPDRAWFAARFRADDPLQLDDPWTLLAALRVLARARPDLAPALALRVDGLGDASNAASAAAETLAALRAEAAGLPLELLHGGIRDAAWAAILAQAMAFVSLHRARSHGPDLVHALRAGLPVVATDYGGTRDLLDEETGFPVRYFAWSVGRSLGPVPGTMPCALADAEHAAARMAEVLDDPVAARARAEAGRERAEARFGISAAAARLLAELDRIRDGLG